MKSTLLQTKLQLKQHPGMAALIASGLKRCSNGAAKLIKRLHDGGKLLAAT